MSASAPVTGAGTPLGFEEYTPRLEVPAGDYQVRLTAVGDSDTVVYDSGQVTLPEGADLLIAAVDNVGLGDSAVQLVVFDGTGAATLFDAGTPAAAIVSGFLASGVSAITALPLDVDFRSIITEAKLRLTHASPATAAVDIYLLPAGADINSADPAFASVPFGADTGVLSIAPGTYDVFVTAAGSKTPAIATTGIAFSGGEVWDVIARDPAPMSMETGPQPLIIDYDSDLPSCVVAP